MNTFHNIEWYEHDFKKNPFHDATEFFDMIHIKPKIISPIYPITHNTIFYNYDYYKVIGSYDFDRKSNQNAYLILKLTKKNFHHWRLIILNRKYAYWHLGGLLIDSSINAIETHSLNSLVNYFPKEIMQEIYNKKY